MGESSGHGLGYDRGEENEGMAGVGWGYEGLGQMKGWGREGEGGVERGKESKGMRVEGRLEESCLEFLMRSGLVVQLEKNK